MSDYDLNLQGPVPECWPGGLAYAQALAAALKVTLDFTSVVLSQNEPSPDDRGKVWFRQNSDDSVEAFYNYFIGPAGAGWYRKEPFIIGEIRPFRNGAPSTRWAFCDGTLGTLNMKSRLIGSTGQGVGLTNRQQGDMVGVESITQTIAQMPAHTHPEEGVIVGVGTGGSVFIPVAVASPKVTGSTGGGQPMDTMSPSIFVPHYEFRGPIYVLAGVV